MARKTTFFDIIYKSFINSVLKGLLLYLLINIFLLFVIYSFILNKNKKIIINETNSKISRIMEHQTLMLDSELTDISNLITLLQSDYQFVLKNTHSFNNIIETENINFVKSDNGVFHKINDNKGSGVYFSSDTIITELLISKAIATEIFDINFIKLVNTNELITRAYFNSKDNMCRIYPDLINGHKDFGPIVHLNEYCFYYEADKSNNPDKAPVWNSIYFDPAGNGQIISCIVPIYNNDILEGVIGLDVDIEVLVNNALTKIVDNNDYNTMVLDQFGTIIAVNNGLKDLLNIQNDSKSASPFSVINSDSYKYNIFTPGNFELLKVYSPVFAINKENAELIISEKVFIVKTKTIPTNKWKIVTFINKNELLSVLERHKKYITILSFFSTLILLLVHFFFIIILKKRISKISKNISLPVKYLSNIVNSDVKELDKSKCESNIVEIDNLTKNIIKLLSNMKLKNEELLEIELLKIEKEKEAEIYKKISITDTLTKLNNRLKIDSDLKIKYDLFKRYDNCFSIIILDIDDFKLINDKHGHLVGDKVLKKVADILKNNSRITDIIGRWGGEEFIIITQEPIGKAYYFTEKLRKKLENTILNTNIRCTASFGIAQIMNEDTIETLLQRADNALYCAKKTGKNKCVIDPSFSAIS